MITGHKNRDTIQTPPYNTVQKYRFYFFKKNKIPFLFSFSLPYNYFSSLSLPRLTTKKITPSSANHSHPEFTGHRRPTRHPMAAGVPLYLSLTPYYSIQPSPNFLTTTTPPCCLTTTTPLRSRLPQPSLVLSSTPP